jgi:hypothetical protein
MKKLISLTVLTLLLAVSSLPAATHYVSLGSTNPTPPYTNWVTAATNVQDAVNVAATDDVVLVTNGVYPGYVSVTNALALLSVNGPQFTIINGGGTKQCVSLTNGASLTGFTLTNGYTGDWGGGVACASTNAFLMNCLIVGNSASNGLGGGAYGSTLYNCTLTGNSAAFANSLGGGACSCTLYNCTLSGNGAESGGGGAFGSTLYNCVVYFNTSSGATNCDSSSILNYCCTTPLPTNGVGNITNAPLFVDSANGNLRLQSNSPCINAGNNAYVTTTIDLDGRPRIVGGTVDMGAYECQSPALLDFYNWLQTYELSTSASSVYLDSDGDGMNNWQEWVCGTNPTNRLSVLRLLSPSITGTKVTVTWRSVVGVNYFLERSANPAAPFTLLATNIVGQAGTTSYGDTNAAGKGPFFYRVGVKCPQAATIQYNHRWTQINTDENSSKRRFLIVEIRSPRSDRKQGGARVGSSHENLCSSVVLFCMDMAKPMTLVARLPRAAPPGPALRE